MKPPYHISTRAAFVLLSLALVSCGPRDSESRLDPGRALGAVLAAETAQAAGAKKEVVLILPQWAANSTVGESFKAALKKQGATLAFTLLANVGDPMARNRIGLKSADFFIAMEKNPGAGAIVSLAGAPLLNAQESAQLNPSHPPVLVVATSSLGDVLGVPADRTLLSGLLESKAVQLAIVDGESDPNAIPAGKADPAQKLFFQHYSILRSQH